MTDTKFSGLTALAGASVATDDVMPIVDTSVTTGKKITVAELINALDALSTFSKAAEVLLQSLADAKGDVIVASAADTWTRLAVGTDYYALVADAAATNGVTYRNTNSNPLEINAQTDSYTAVASDAGKLITLTKATAVTMTIPANASVAYPVGTQLHFYQGGAGQVTVAITSDTLNGTPTLKLRTQHSVATAIKLTSTTWVLTGDLAGF